MRSKSSMSRSTPASRAIASRCSTPLVEPPLVAIAAIAFSSPSRVMMSLGRWPRASTLMTSLPASYATSAVPGVSAGATASPAREHVHHELARLVGDLGLAGFVGPFHGGDDRRDSELLEFFRYSRGGIA